jgi:hypothetical protein
MNSAEFIFNGITFILNLKNLLTDTSLILGKTYRWTDRQQGNLIGLTILFKGRGLRQVGRQFLITIDCLEGVFHLQPIQRT